jgi:hypothetical protein
MEITCLRRIVIAFSGEVKAKRWQINLNQFALGLKMAAHFSSSSSVLL